MFLYDPEQYIEWLGYPSQGEFFRVVFTSPSINKDKLYPPCAKTLNKYFLSSGDERHSTQSEKFIQRLKDISIARGVSADFFDTPSKPIPISQFAIRYEWTGIFKGLQITGCYPQACAQAEYFLSELKRLLDSLDGLGGRNRVKKILENDWLRASLMELNVELRVNDSDFDIVPEQNRALFRTLHYLNIYLFIKLLAAFDADFNSTRPMEHKQSIFHKLMPSYPLDKWVPHRSGLFEPLLARFPSKLIGYKAFSKYAGCNEDSIATSLRQFYARKRNLKFKKIREWLRGALEELAKKEEFDVEEVLNYCEPMWWVADILSGWIHVTGDQELDHDLVTCFSHYNRFYNEAIGSREP
ncbi:hypothetical protein AHGSH82_024650 [Aeromonas hydrophila]|uniref:hypothetical protein n=1 Tax=Aeromonas hydrophila TaxID=644 RepID=UPI00101B0ACE|nr:hypothetical protein [Aeromonas hydrophila]BBG85320.1 hypothetical protein AHGSH82_024650 [Aeromonas hydrophila]BBT62625.1 hypothetical protein WP8S18E02_24220 [Aeromonas hydrophila]